MPPFQHFHPFQKGGKLLLLLCLHSVHVRMQADLGGHQPISWSWR